MRISTSTIYDSGVSTMQQQTERLFKVQQQISSNRRMLTPADDPVAAARALEVSQSQSINAQYGTNGGTANDSLALEESVLGNIYGLLQDVRDVTVNAGNPALSQSDRATLANDLRGRYQELLGLANSVDGSGQYLFSGYQGGTRPFHESAPGTVVYNGDQGQRLMQISASRQIAVSDAGADVMQRIPAGNGTFVTQAGAGNTGNGVIDTGTVLNAANWNAAGSKDLTVKFAGTATVAAAAGNTAGGASATAGIVDQALWNAGGKNYSIAFTSATSYNIIDNTTGTIASAGAYSSGATISFQGFSAVITDGVDAFGGAVTPQNRDTFAIKSGPASALTYDIVYRDKVTNLDMSLLTNQRAGAPPYGRSFATVGSIDFKSRGAEPAFDLGITMTINGTPNAGDSFTVAASSSHDVFTTLNELATLLETTPSGAALTNGLVSTQRNLDNAMNNVLTLRASAGARLKELDSVTSAGEERGLQYSQTLSRLQDLDYAKAASELAQQQVNLQAAQKSFTMTAGLSLFNYLS